MIRSARTAILFGIGAVTLAAGEASAGCAIVGGTRMCATWIKGSEICNVAVDPQLLEGWEGEPVTIECKVEGGQLFSGVGEGGPYSYACPTGELPPGVLTCGPAPETSLVAASFRKSGGKGLAKGHEKHGCKHGGKNVGHDDPGCAIYDDGDPISVLTSEPVNATCKPNVNAGEGDPETACTAIAEVLPPAGSTCENGGKAVDFTASQFLGTVEACFDTGEGLSCTQLYQFCTLNDNLCAADGGKYDCVEVPNPDYVCYED